MALRRPRLVLALVSVSLVAAMMTADVASAALSKRTAQRAAFKVAKRVAVANGAVLWWAGRCARRSANHVVCWGAVVYPSYEGCAQKISVRKSGSRVSARRAGRVYCADLSEEAQQNSGSSSGGWAICGIRQSVCIGS
jgi:hypothetical protein